MSRAEQRKHKLAQLGVAVDDIEEQNVEGMFEEMKSFKCLQE